MPSGLTPETTRRLEEDLQNALMRRARRFRPSLPPESSKVLLAPNPEDRAFADGEDLDEVLRMVVQVQYITDKINLKIEGLGSSKAAAIIDACVIYSTLIKQEVKKLEKARQGTRVKTKGKTTDVDFARWTAAFNNAATYSAPQFYDVSGSPEREP